MPETGENINPLRRQEFFFWLCAYAAVLVFLGSNALFGPEALVAEAAREIVVSRDWNPVCINFQPFQELHPLNVCSIALLYIGLGISEFTTRLIAAVTALILFSGVRRLAVLLFDRRTALIAGWLALGTYSVLYLGRSAGDCIPACAAVVWAVAWYLGTSAPMGFTRALIFYLLLFFAAVLYGNWFLLPLGFLLPGWIDERSLRGALSLRGVAALLIVAGLGFLWWVKSGGGGGLFALRFDPAAVREALAAALRGLGDSYLAKRWKIFLGPLDILRVLLPWTLLALAAGVTAARRFKTAAPKEKMLWQGAAAMFATMLVLPTYQWRLLMPLLPFLVLMTAHGFTGEADDPCRRGALFITRAALMAAAALGAVSPAALPVLTPLLKFELPLVVIPTCTVTGIAVLAIMFLDSYPGMPLCRLSGLPARLNSIVLGGTLITVGVVSLILPALRDMRGEKPFLRGLRKELSEFNPANVIFIGDARQTAALLFYTGMKSSVSPIPIGDEKRFSEIVERNRGGRLAVISRNRDGEGRELDFLRRCAELNNFKADTANPALSEELTPFGDPDKRIVFFMIPVPGKTPPETVTSTAKEK